MKNRLGVFAMLALLLVPAPVLALDKKPDGRLLLAQPTTCNRAWLMQFCPRGCDEAADCRTAVIDHRLKEGDCMNDPIKASEKVNRSCTECNRVFCR